MGAFSHDSSDSPFEQIRHLEEDGSEHWIARELMPRLDYCRWNEFKPVIEKAIIDVVITEL